MPQNPDPLTHASLVTKRGEVSPWHPPHSSQEVCTGSGAAEGSLDSLSGPCTPMVEGEQDWGAVIGPYVGYKVPDGAAWGVPE